MDLVFFLIFAIFAVACAINVVVQSHPISSALSLVGVMCSLAILYLLLGAEFIAMAQIIVYAGAIMVLFVFVIMLLNTGAEAREGVSLSSKILGIPSVLGFGGILSYLLLRQFGGAMPVVFGNYSGGTARNIGRALFTSYLLPFEVTSVLILIAIIGVSQYFTQAYVVDPGGRGNPGGSTLFFNMNLYKEGWSYNNMGYASALAWIMLLVVVAAALILFRTSGRWVFYAGGDR